MNDILTVLCSARCVHNDGKGYYSTCQHPKLQNRPPYGCLDREYRSVCKLKEAPDGLPKCDM